MDKTHKIGRNLRFLDGQKNAMLDKLMVKDFSEL